MYVDLLAHTRGGRVCFKVFLEMHNRTCTVHATGPDEVHHGIYNVSWNVLRCGFIGRWNALSQRRMRIPLTTPDNLLYHPFVCPLRPSLYRTRTRWRLRKTTPPLHVH